MTFLLLSDERHAPVEFNGYYSGWLHGFTGCDRSSARPSYSSYSKLVKCDICERQSESLNSKIGAEGHANATPGSTLTHLNYPSDIIVDPSGGVFVSHSGNHRVVFWGNAASARVLIAGTGSALCSQKYLVCILITYIPRYECLCYI